MTDMASPDPGQERAAPLLSVRDLHVTYRGAEGGVPAVRGVSFDLAVGETLGLAGESGCGKSTLAGAILRLLPKGTTVTGEVLLNGEDVLTMKPGRLRAVRWTEAAIVFQGALHGLNSVQRIGAQVAEPLEVHGRAEGSKAKVAELLEVVGIPARRAAEYPHQLSGGQRQRVLIALALACDPSLLIADEPTTALDVMVQAQVLDLLEKLQRELGLAVVFITHDLSTLAANCERIAVMYAGRIVEQAACRPLFETPWHPYTAGLLHSRPVLGRRGAGRHLDTIPGAVPDPKHLPPGCSFEPRCPRRKAICAQQMPPLEEKSPGRQARCWVAP